MTTILDPEDEYENWPPHLWRPIRRVLTDLARVRSHPTGVKESAEQRLHAILQWLENNDDASSFGSFQRNHLGVYIASFFYGDHSNRKVHQLSFAPATGNTDVKKEYAIPYVWREIGQGHPTSEHRSAFVDRLFLLHRAHQDPWQQSGKRIPEYFFDLPWGPISLEDGPRTLKVVTWKDAWEVERATRNSVGIHYVPFGERVFFTYAWRRLIRQLLEENGVPQTASETVIWNSPYWRDLQSGSSWEFEGQLSEWSRSKIITIRKTLNDPETEEPLNNSGQPVAFIPDENFGLCDAGVLEDDWRALGLVINEGQVGPGLKPLIRYASVFFPEHVEQSVLDKWHTSSSANIASQLLSTLREQLNAASDAFIGNGSAQVRLSSLHRRSRFPIIPYFYWQALEPMIAKTHMVVPILASIANPIVVARRSYEGLGRNDTPQSLGDAVGGDPIASPNIGIAVSAINPLAGLDWTLSNSTASVDWHERTRRARGIRYVMECVAAPQGDYSYYEERSGSLDVPPGRADLAKAMIQAYSKWGSDGHPERKRQFTSEFYLQSELTSASIDDIKGLYNVPKRGHLGSGKICSGNPVPHEILKRILSSRLESSVSLRFEQTSPILLPMPGMLFILNLIHLVETLQPDDRDATLDQKALRSRVEALTFRDDSKRGMVAITFSAQDPAEMPAPYQLMAAFHDERKTGGATTALRALIFATEETWVNSLANPKTQEQAREFCRGWRQDHFPIVERKGQSDQRIHVPLVDVSLDENDLILAWRRCT